MKRLRTFKGITDVSPAERNGLMTGPNFQYRHDVLQALRLLKREGVAAVTQMDAIVEVLEKKHPGMAGESAVGPLSRF